MKRFSAGAAAISAYWATQVQIAGALSLAQTINKAKQVAHGWKRDLDCDDEGYLRGSGGGAPVAQEAGAGVALIDGREGHTASAAGTQARSTHGSQSGNRRDHQIAASKKAAFRPAKELKEAV